MQNKIEQMTKDLCDIDCKGMKCNVCDSYGCEYHTQAKALYNAGYRKSQDVAEEIFAEMREELVRYIMLNENIAIKCKEENGEWNSEYWKGKLSAFKQIRGYIDAELKKKYAEQEK